MHQMNHRHPGRLVQTAYLLMATLLLAGTLQSAMAQERPIVMIDPGHGGEVAGSSAEGLEEKDLVLRMAFVLADQYVQAGFDVRLTRTGDYNIGFDERRAMAEEAGAAMMVSLHVKRDDDPSANGVEIYANMEDARAAAAAHQVGEALRQTGMPVLVVGREWEFLKSPTATTVMMEVGFVTNPSDRERIVTEAFQRELAELVVEATSALLTAKQQ